MIKIRNGKQSQLWQIQWRDLTLLQFLSDKSSNFKKFDYADDDDEIFDLDDLFGELHDNTLNFHGFPPSVLKQFQEIVEAMQQFDDEPQNSQRQRLFENKYNDFRQKTDQDLDGKLYAEQLDTLLKRISPGLAPQNVGPTPPVVQKKAKILDADKILDIIHGTFKEEITLVKPRKRQVQKVPSSPHHFGGLPSFDMPQSSSRTWGKTVMTIRKQDGSCETRRMERSPDGQTKTTITKTDSNGTSSTETFTGDGQQILVKPVQAPQANGNYAERHLIMFDGYKIPCLW